MLSEGLLYISQNQPDFKRFQTQMPLKDKQIT